MAKRKRWKHREKKPVVSPRIETSLESFQEVFGLTMPAWTQSLEPSDTPFLALINAENGWHTIRVGPES